MLLDALRGRDSGLGLDEFAHSLQTASRAERAGATRELVVAALLHDVGKALTDRDHGRVAAELLAGSVDPQICWVVGVHQDFTAAEIRNGRPTLARYRHVLHPGFRRAARFADDWDVASRDPDYEAFPLEHFVPMVQDVLAEVRLPTTFERWTERFTAGLSHLPGGVAAPIERASTRPRRWVKRRLGGR